MTARIHFFRTDLPTSRLAALESLLSRGERERVGRFKFDADRARYIASHGILHEILGGYLGCEPGSIAFDYGIKGKPVIAGQRDGLEFSLSHSQDLGLLAVTRGAQVGVDIEAVRPLDEALEIARSRFTPTESAAVGSTEDFFALWTRKEAVSKCLGLGLSLPYDAFELSPRPGAVPERVVVDWQGKRSVQWLQEVPVDRPGFLAAVATSAVEPPAWELA